MFYRKVKNHIHWRPSSRVLPTSVSQNGAAVGLLLLIFAGFLLFPVETFWGNSFETFPWRAFLRRTLPGTLFFLGSLVAFAYTRKVSLFPDQVSSHSEFGPWKTSWTEPSTNYLGVTLYRYRSSSRYRLPGWIYQKWIYQVLLVHQEDPAKDIVLFEAPHWAPSRNDEKLKQLLLEEAQQFAGLLSKPLNQYKDIQRTQPQYSADLSFVDDKDLFR